MKRGSVATVSRNLKTGLNRSTWPTCRTQFFCCASCTNSAQAAELVQLAQQKNCVLQVGHVERFNPVFKFLETVATEPRFIECHRLSPYPARSMDIGVVLRS